jgi:D-psicose/D-tagatose/L-ribulose 3-epimerase
MNIEEDGFVLPLQQVGDRLGYVHVGESHAATSAPEPSTSCPFFEALSASGYQGAVTFESFSSAVVHPELSNDLAVWRKPLE